MCFGCRKEQGNEYSDGVEKILSEMEATKRAALGFKCKWIIDIGRLMWLRELGLDAKLVRYVPPSISPENHLLLAKPLNWLFSSFSFYSLGTLC